MRCEAAKHHNAGAEPAGKKSMFVPPWEQHGARKEREWQGE
jgi:hypothetical protein